MEDVMIIDLLSQPDADHLRIRLGAERATTARFGTSDWTVLVNAGDDPHEFAQLLRTIEHWAGARGLGAVRVHIDGRPYVLAAREPFPHRHHAMFDSSGA